MKRFLFLCITALILLSSACNTGKPAEQNFTVPSWTLYQRALQSGKSAEEAKTLLISKDYPYNINATINGDPATRIGIAWFTNANVTGSVVQIVEGKVDKISAFSNATVIQAISTAIDTVNYVSIGSANRNSNEELIAATGFSAGEKRSYTGNKALIDNLKPNTTYSYRVGKKGTWLKKGYWSETGTFTTAKNNKDSFEFIYVTDTQANADEMFDISKTTIETAYRQTPEAKFLLITGDLIDSGGTLSSEWEWEQWFEKMQNIWLHLPIAMTQGNHDTSPFRNMFNHFNTDNSFNTQQTGDETRTTIGGTVYSFVYGDALFLILNYEDYRKGEPYFSALEQWIREQVSKHADVKWRIAAFHKTMFTGSAGHQNDSDGKIIRERFAPIFQELNFDLAIQGHDHIYQVIGVIAADGTNFTHLADAVSNQTIVETTPADGRSISADVTGKRGGIYDVSNGTLYFLNNSAGKKKYYPRSKEQMEAALPQHGVKNYFGLFNKFGQTGEPTFSRVKISTDTIEIDTYTVDDNGKTTLFDAFRIVKN